jgi:hypothetical protein
MNKNSYKENGKGEKMDKRVIGKVMPPEFL